LKAWLAKKPKDAKAIFVLNKASHVDVVRANAIGATQVVRRPLNERELLTGLLGEFNTICQDSRAIPDEVGPGVSAGLDALRDVFLSACLGEGFESGAVQTAGEQIVSQIGAQGLSSWIDTVRKHHSQTYQHCLLVTGVAVAFGQHLGLSNKDRMRLSFAGMLHDIGKARIPVAILEKPGPLDENEITVMRQHPQFGMDALAAVPDLPAEMTEIVLHHHEFLDGSGYPHKLKGPQISDFVRLMTISDIFGALIERRSYKAPLSANAAYQILLDMGPRLDQDLVREFRAVARFN
jgi:putative nucleotidyltransferase with HDIG domain